MPHARARDGAKIHYRRDGSRGRAVVMVQGLGLSGRFWFDLPSRVAARGSRVIWPDNRGTGRSDAIRRPITMGTLADDVAAVMDDAGIDRATLVGVSMGGMISQHVALRHPERVDGLVLMATTPGLPHGRLPSADMLGTLARLPFARGKRGHGELLAKVLLPPEQQTSFREVFARWPDAFAADPQRLESFFLQLGAIATHSTGARLGSLKVPTVVMTGAEDALVPPANSRILAEKIPGAALEVLQGVGHALPMQRPDAVERALDQVWARS